MTAIPKDLDKFSAEQVADVLSVSKRNLETWAKNGKLVPEYIIGKDVLYTKKQLEQFEQFQSFFNSSWDQEQLLKPDCEYNSIELFAGAGGLALGLEEAGFKHVLLNEVDKSACATLRHNRPNWNVIEGDIRKVDFTTYKNSIDLLTGGFPCQAFSYAGKKLGFEDIRGTMFFEFARALKEIQPKIFLAENVKGLLSHDDGKTLETIKNIINELGYELVENNIYKAIFYKVPQKRERLILVGVRKDLVEKATFIPPSPYKRILTVKDALKKGVLFESDVPVSVGQKYPKRKKEIFDHVPEGGYWRDLPLDLQKEYMQASFYLGGGKTGMARRLSWNEPSLTLTCAPAQKQTERCHPTESRPLTVREYARIQTFPDNWIFQGSMSAQYKQIGNAVPVNLSLALGKALIRMLNNLN
ncbi:DNA cytosine methyltransferase [Acinetobacter junii]|uniref:DNA cytosine methyltransferase n=1 Tax=Acinetobacter junii TaxID=40215 RepID=UPI00100F3B68|nr:helix-turn-helix domain-containing protein [Acinetobacter junii]RXS91511.1 DNA (cytosine-5-)-methyltransferase [Acinetobacter junii]